MMHSNMTRDEAQAIFDALIVDRMEIDAHICAETGWDISKSLFSKEVNPVTTNREWIEVNDAIIWLQG